MVTSYKYTPARATPTEYDYVPDSSESFHPDKEVIKTYIFSGGIDRSKPPELIDDGYLRTLNNGYYPGESAFPRNRPAVGAYQTGAAAPGRITNVYVYQKDSTTSYVVFSCLNAGGDDQELYYLDGSKAKVQISSSLGSTTPPTFHTFGGKLLVAVPGQNLREWAGYTAGGAAKATGTVTVDTNPSDGETVVIASKTYTFKTTRASVTQITIGADANATADNIATVLGTDTWDVTASATTGVVTITYCRTGEVGNSAPLTDGTGGNLTLSGATLAGGVNGLALDEVESYESPHGGIVLGDHNGRVVVAGCTLEPDRVYFSAPANAFHWASGSYGNGEYIDVGYQEGNTISAVVPYLDELMVHKTGQNRELYRIDITDSDVDSWNLTRRFHSGASSAIGPRCALSVSDIHFALDKDTFRVYTSEDTYDEIASSIDGLKVWDFLAGASTTASFMAYSPGELYTLIALAPNTKMLVFHPGSRRWATWSFPSHNIYCACWHEDDQVMLIGCSDGKVYKLDKESDTDSGSSGKVQMEIVGKAFGAKSMLNVMVKQVSLDYQNLIEGGGTFGLVNCLADDAPITTDSFTTTSAAPLLYYSDDADDTLYLWEQTPVYLYSVNYSRKVSYAQATGESVSPRVLTTSGAAIIHFMCLRAGYYGRAYK